MPQSIRPTRQAVPSKDNLKMCTLRRIIRVRVAEVKPHIKREKESQRKQRLQNELNNGGLFNGNYQPYCSAYDILGPVTRSQTRRNPHIMLMGPLYF